MRALVTYIFKWFANHAQHICVSEQLNLEWVSRSPRANAAAYTRTIVATACGGRQRRFGCGISALI